MLTELCQEVHNWFDVERHAGHFIVQNGTLDVDFLREGQYFRVIGSVFNDGVYQFHIDILEDEEFDGAVWALAIPKAFLEDAKAIKEWRDKYEAVDSAAMSPFNSESFGGYSYSKSGGGTSGSSSGGSANWKTVFASKLNRWRKLQ